MRILAAFCAVLCAVAAPAGTQPQDNPRTAWFRQAQWGVFMHYMADTVGATASAEAWNAAVDQFDTEGLADQLASAGAGYFILTLGQNSGYFCAPNATYDGIVGITPSKCSRRDLPADLAAALKKRGIRLMVYLPAGAPDRDETAMAKLEWQNGKHPFWTYRDGNPRGEDARLVSFQRKWESVIAEWSKRWGKDVSGWWFDGCYFPDAMYRHPDAPNFESFAAAARAGNPDSIVAFNPGVENPIITLTPAEDYTAGEINAPDRLKYDQTRIGNAQLHMLSFLGPNWCQKPPRFTTAQAVQHTRDFVEKGGVVTWDVPPDGASGKLLPTFLEQLQAIGKALGTAK